MIFSQLLVLLEVQWLLSCAECDGIFELKPQLNTPIKPMIQIEIQGICEKSHSHMCGFATHSRVLLGLTSGLTIIGELQSVTKLLRHTLYSNRVT